MKHANIYSEYIMHK